MNVRLTNLQWIERVSRWGKPYKMARFRVKLPVKVRDGALTSCTVTGHVFLRPRKVKRHYTDNR